MRRFIFGVLTVLSLSGCLGLPANLEPVTGFEVERYMGTWYEIYRLDHPFERGLSQVTATYTLQDDGSVKVENYGMKPDGSADTIVGKALFQGDPSVASLKVSFFGPFFSGYHVIALDKENYQYAMVAGPNFDYLWILSRTPQLSQETTDLLLTQAEESGYNVGELITVEQDVAE